MGKAAQIDGGAGPRKLGRYHLLASLGSGGMATIHLARIAGPAGFERPVAVKVIHDHLAQDPQFVQMFLSEAKIAATLSHPNIVQVYDLAEDGGTYFIAMEYLAGHNLSEIIGRVGAQPEGVIDLRSGCHIVAEACEGLHHAHETTDMEGRPLELVHRDISPQNIFVTYDGAVKLMDFGIARAAGIAASTRPGSLKGKFSYMSPEQARGEELDRRTDVFAMGIVLWELLSGRRLFKGSSDMDTLTRVARAEAAPLSLIRGDVPPSLDAVVAKALSVRREDRFATAADLHDALSEVIGQLGPPVKSRQLAKRVSRWFASEKAAKRELLARASRVAASGAPEHPNAAAAPVDIVVEERSAAQGTPSGWQVPSANSAASGELAAASEADTVAEPSRSVSVVLAHPRRRGPIIALVSVVALVVLVAAAAVFLGLGAEPVEEARPVSASTVPPARPAPAPALESGPAPAPVLDGGPAPIKTVTLTVAATPPEARFTLDGEALEGNPFSGAFEPSSTPHRLVVEAEGYEPLERTIRLEESLRLELSLTRTKAPAKAATAAKRPVTSRPQEAGSGESAPPPPATKRATQRPHKNEIYTVPPWER